MTSTSTAGVTMAPAEARQLTARIRDALTVADGLLVTAYRGRAWAALGHASWEAWAQAELPPMRLLRLSVEDRRALVAGLTAEGRSTRAIADALGRGVATIHEDKAANRAAGIVGPDLVTGADGSRRRAVTGPRVPAPAEAGPLVDRLVELVRAAGPGGLSCAEVKTRTRLGHERVSAALSRLAAAGRLSYTAPARRGLHGRYTATS